MSNSRSTRAGWVGWLLAIVAVTAVVAVIIVAGLSRTPNPVDTAAPAAQPGIEKDLSTPAPAPEITTLSGPWQPGSTFYLTPDYPTAGVPFEVTECTVAFSFDNGQGRSFAVTASHCGNAGDLVWPSSATTAGDYANEVGRVIYSDLEVPSEVHNDVGIIEILDRGQPMPSADAEPVAPRVAKNSAVVDSMDEICKVGGTTGRTCGTAGESERQELFDANGGSVLTEGNTAHLCAARGDSGGPVTTMLRGEEVIVGLVSGTRNPEEPASSCEDPEAYDMTVSYTPTDEIMRVIADVVPAVDL